MLQWRLPERFQDENSLVEQAYTAFATGHSNTIENPLWNQKLDSVVREAVLVHFRIFKDEEGSTLRFMGMFSGETVLSGWPAPP